MPLAAGLELDPRVDEALTAHARPDAGPVEQLGHVVLEDAGADPRLDVLVAAVLEDHRVDPLAVEELTEREPRGTGADDPDLGAAHAAGRSNSAACPCPTPTHIVASP